MSVQARVNPPHRLSRGDHLRNLADDLMALASRVDRDARSHHEAEDRINEAERIAQAVRRLARG